MCNALKTGRYGAWFSVAAGHILTGSDLGTKHVHYQMMRGVETPSAADVARELDIHWVVHRIVRDQLDYREVCAQRTPQRMTKHIV
jgi:hypothetical protein